jgi:DsbC/DsbD-like thiol-disulfide interchange protein
MRPKIIVGLCTALALIAMTMAWHSDAQAGGKSDSKVKASAKATKAGADGKQTITITLEIEKGWYIYGNPVGAEDFDGNKTNVAVSAKEKVVASVKYPEAKVKVEKIGKEELRINIYEDKVIITAQVTRTMGDASPLQISIDVNSCNKGTCLAPGKVKLTVP